jgi:6-phosphogluconate dehydrogenase
MCAGVVRIILLCLQGGCIIRAKFLDDIKTAYKNNPDLENLLLDEEFAKRIAQRNEAWREVIKLAITQGNTSASYCADC